MKNTISLCLLMLVGITSISSATNIDHSLSNGSANILTADEELELYCYAELSGDGIYVRRGASTCSEAFEKVKKAYEAAKEASKPQPIEG